MNEASSYTAFAEHQRVAAGALPEVAVAVKRYLSANPAASLLIFDDATSQQVHPDLRGSERDILERLAPAPPEETPAIPERSGPGRPKLGVVAREITLLPRHWEWLNAQPGGASVALRKLVEEARRSSGEKDRVRGSQEVAYRFMSAIAGNLPGFEEATRALFARNPASFEEHIAEWPADVRDHARKLAEPVFAEETAPAA